MIARLKRGKDTFDLAVDPYSIADDFAPPPTLYNDNISIGTSANALGGGVLIGRQAANTTLAFLVNIDGDTEYEVTMSARRLVSFLLRDSADPLFFEYSPFDLPEPLWGQLGAPMRYEIIAPNTPVIRGDTYADATVRAYYLGVTCSFVIKPFGFGTMQGLGESTGGVWLDTIGSADGEPWGIRIPETTTNKMTNPVFSHNVFNNNWLYGASLEELENNDPRYCFPGSPASALLTALASTNNTETQSIAAGNTNKHSFSAIVARPDGAPVTSDDVVIWYGSAKATTFQSLGNGFYLIYADNIDGIAAATATGVQVKIGRSIYLLAFQMEEKAYHTPICFGDMLGCAWTGTVAASTTTRTAAHLDITITQDNSMHAFRNSLWSVHLVWKPDYGNSKTGDRYLWNCGTALTYPFCYFNATDDKIYVSDNTNTASTAALTFSAGDVLEVLCVAGNAGLAVYVKNHTTGVVSSGTNATYTIAALQSKIFIGTDSAAANPAGGIFQLFEIYQDDLTSAQNTALQSAVGAAVAAGLRPWHIPFYSNALIANCIMAGADNSAVVGDIPGSIPALTEIRCVPTIGASETGIHFWVYENDYAVKPSNLFGDVGDQADAACAGGYYLSLTVDTSEDSTTFSIPAEAVRALFGKKIYLLVRLKEGTALTTTLTAAGAITIGTVYRSENQTISTTNSYKLYRIGPISFPDWNSLVARKWFFYPFSATVTLYLTRGSGSAAVNIDWMALAVERVSYSSVVATQTIEDGSVLNRTTSALSGLLGDPLYLTPGRYNHINFIIGANGGPSDPINSSLALAVYVTPRWSLL